MSRAGSSITMTMTAAFSKVGSVARGAPRYLARASGSDKARRSLVGGGGLAIDLLDFVVALARKVGGFCALLTLGWIYFRQLALGESLHQIFPGASDPDLRQTMYVALFLIMAQGWDIPVDEIVVYGSRLRARLPASATPSPGARRHPLLAILVPAAEASWRTVEPVVARLGCFMDLCVAIANKVGALAVLAFLVILAKQVWWDGSSVQQMYPGAADPTISLLADLCVYVVVLGWWAMPMRQIRIFWHRLREVSARSVAENPIR